MIPAIGAMKTAYADTKLRKVFALEMIIHGTVTHPPTSIANTTPRRMLKYFGIEKRYLMKITVRKDLNNFAARDLTVTKGYRIGRDVHSDLCKTPQSCTKEGSCTTAMTSLPLCQNIERTP